MEIEENPKASQALKVAMENRLGYFDGKTCNALAKVNHDLRNGQEKIIRLCSSDLEQFLKNEDYFAVQAMCCLPIKYTFGSATRNVLQAAYRSDDFDTMNSFAKIGYAQHMAELIITDNDTHGDFKIVWLKGLIVENHDQLLKDRFNVWGDACCRSAKQKSRNKALTLMSAKAANQESAELDDKIFTIIIKQLFSGQVDEKDERKRSLLDDAIDYESEYAVKFLIEHKAKMDAFDVQSLWLNYNIHRQPEIVKLLIAGSDNSSDKREKALLPDERNAKFGEVYSKHCYQMSGSWIRYHHTRTVESILLLLNAGADVNAVDKNKGSALHDYTKRNRIDEVITLIECGADTTLQDNKGKTAYDYAIKQGKIAMLLVLNQSNGFKLTQELRKNAEK